MIRDHLRLVHGTRTEPPRVEQFAFFVDPVTKLAFIHFNGEWDIAEPGYAGFDAFVRIATNIEALAQSTEPMPWPLPKVPA